MKLKNLLSFLLVAFSLTAEAQIACNKMLFSIPYKTEMVQNITVNNTSEERTLRVKTESRLMLKPEDDRDPGITTGALLVSPKEFTLPPGALRVIRIVQRKAPQDREEVYRISVIPTAAEDGNEKINIVKGKNIKLTVLTGVGMLIFGKPEHEIRKISWSYENGKFQLKNTGNVNFLLDTLSFCNAGNSCIDTTIGNRIYAGETLTKDTKQFDFIKLNQSYEDVDKSYQLKGSSGELTLD